MDIRMTKVRNCWGNSARKEITNGDLFSCSLFPPLSSHRRHPFANRRRRPKGGTDGENAFLLAKFGRQDRKHFSSTWLACVNFVNHRVSLISLFMQNGSKFAALFESCFILMRFSFLAPIPHTPPTPPERPCGLSFPLARPRGGEKRPPLWILMRA